MKLSVIIPVYNEKETIREICTAVKAVALDKEIIIVDDCSTDGTREILRAMAGDTVEYFFMSETRERVQPSVPVSGRQPATWS